jgi:drug/metabolite transporter (DMT)-like permease
VERIGILLATGVAILWGSADVCATLGARRLGTMTTTFISLLVSVITLTLFGAIAFGQLALTPQLLGPSIPLGLLTGVMAALGYATFYRGLELGPIAIVSPLAATDGAIAAVLAILLLHERVSAWQVGTLLVIFFGIILASTSLEELTRLLRPSGERPLVRGGIRWGIIAALAFGLMLFGIGAASQRWGWFLPIFWTRFFGALALAGVIGWRSYRSGCHPERSEGSASPADRDVTLSAAKGLDVSLFRLGAGFALGVGLFETAGLVMYSVGTQIAATSIVATISSTFTIIPILFGITFLRERPAVNQLVGVCMVIAGLLLLGIKPV